MPELNWIFHQRRGEFEREIAGLPDTKATCDACVRYLGDVRRDYLDEVSGTAVRLRLNELMAAAEAGIGMMVAVSQPDAPKLSGPAEQGSLKKAGAAISRALPFIPGAMCAVLAAWLFLDGAMTASVMALASGGVSVGTSMLSGLGKAKQRKQIPVAEAKVDAPELGRWMEALLKRMDELLAGGRGIGQDEQLLIGGGLMESVQMLMEAKLTEDGAFALKALPQMMSALEAQGVVIEMFTAENRAYFDLMPAPEGGETIRPALVKDGKLLMRGQATVKG